MKQRSDYSVGTSAPSKRPGGLLPWLIGILIALVFVAIVLQRYLLDSSRPIYIRLADSVSGWMDVLDRLGDLNDELDASWSTYSKENDRLLPVSPESVERLRRRTNATLDKLPDLNARLGNTFLNYYGASIRIGITGCNENDYSFPAFFIESMFNDLRQTVGQMQSAAAAERLSTSLNDAVSNRLEAFHHLSNLCFYAGQGLLGHLPKDCRPGPIAYTHAPWKDSDTLTAKTIRQQQQEEIRILEDSGYFIYSARITSAQEKMQAFRQTRIDPEYLSLGQDYQDLVNETETDALHSPEEDWVGIPTIASVLVSSLEIEDSGLTSVPSSWRIKQDLDSLLQDFTRSHPDYAAITHAAACYYRSVAARTQPATGIILAGLPGQARSRSLSVGDILTCLNGIELRPDLVEEAIAPILDNTEEEAIFLRREGDWWQEFDFPGHFPECTFWYLFPPQKKQEVDLGLLYY